METTDLSTEQLDNEIEALQPEKARFTVTDAASADWVLRKLANIRAEQVRTKQYAATRDAELEADYNRLMARFGGELEAFAREESEARHRKTITLPNGSLAFRAVNPKLIVENLETATTTARAVCPSAFITETVERPTAYETVSIEKLDEAAFIKHAQETMSGENGTGEILPGLKLTEAGETFSINFPKEKEKKASG